MYLELFQGTGFIDYFYISERDNRDAQYESLFGGQFITGIMVKGFNEKIIFLTALYE